MRSPRTGLVTAQPIMSQLPGGLGIEVGHWARGQLSQARGVNPRKLSPRAQRSVLGLDVPTRSGP